ncbi:MAG: hypothetical protein OSA84_03000 [Akkermansiaceae bacterium]|nr:hypothetical protein [Akkermansiaceae bacterium]
MKLRGIHAEGLERTSARRVNKILEPLEGEWYDQAAMNSKVKDLLATGAFKSVRSGSSN